MKLKESLSKAAESASKAAKKASEATKDAVGNVVDNVSKTAGQVGDVTKKAAGNIAGNVGKAAETVGTLAQDTGAKAVTLVASAKDSVVIEKAKEGASMVGKGATKTARVVSGYEAYDSRKKAKSAKEEADALKAETEAENERRREECNKVLEAYGESKLQALKNGVKPFLHDVELLGSRFKEKFYEIQGDVKLDNAEITRLESVTMNASTAMKTLAAAGGAATIALAGVPAITSAAVGAFATASTGTAISSLSGAAASNAVLAWLGGGSIAAGGGGVAAGSVVMAGITATATGVFALAAAGIISSAYFSKKHTEATQYLEEVKKARAKAELGWQVMEGIKQRANELKAVTDQLEQRVKTLLVYLDPLVYDFQKDDEYYVKTFQEAALGVKSISEIAQIPLVDNEGNINSEVGVLVSETQKILNSKL